MSDLPEFPDPDPDASPKPLLVSVSLSAGDSFLLLMILVMLSFQNCTLRDIQTSIDKATDKCQAPAKAPLIP